MPLATDPPSVVRPGVAVTKSRHGVALPIGLFQFEQYITADGSEFGGDAPDTVVGKDWILRALKQKRGCEFEHMFAGVCLKDEVKMSVREFLRWHQRLKVCHSLAAARATPRCRRVHLCTGRVASKGPDSRCRVCLWVDAEPVLRGTGVAGRRGADAAGGAGGGIAAGDACSHLLALRRTTMTLVDTHRHLLRLLKAAATCSRRQRASPFGLQARKLVNVASDRFVC